MKILLLASESPLEAFLRQGGDEVVRRDEPLDAAALAREGFSVLVSHGYRHILRPPVLDLFPGRAVNLHISLLPWNRGADPNLWSFLEDTPKGVTIHHLDPGVDTGDVIAQREVVMNPGDTLRSSYARLQEEILSLFREQWPAIRAGTAPRTPQATAGTAHRLKDKEPYLDALALGWDTPVADLTAYGVRRGLRRAP